MTKVSVSFLGALGALGDADVLGAISDVGILR